MSVKTVSDTIRGLSEAQRRAVQWMLDHGSDVAVARVNGGGRIFLGQGEHAPFLPSTARALIEAGVAEYVDLNGKKSVRFRLVGDLKKLAGSMREARA
ncbi:hypothetical protein BSL82_05780 [Tardibacter chloracetimidivorans]|uniref:Uncharacterized protein n=1 Tax=Tardibacter chloracetimidivorans TaxID=1921510 RepID=A0A1L3ZTG2_9SPHN|nr:hypothetical protein [Tardibacter chloracetimidivorans]API58879.1 hypothetical protein BSL82_05780 [Tardibacter chloracetimidivorans]